MKVSYLPWSILVTFDQFEDDEKNSFKSFYSELIEDEHGGVFKLNWKSRNERLMIIDINQRDVIVLTTDVTWPSKSRTKKFLFSSEFSTQSLHEVVFLVSYLTTEAFRKRYTILIENFGNPKPVRGDIPFVFYFSMMLLAPNIVTLVNVPGFFNSHTCPIDGTPIKEAPFGGLVCERGHNFLTKDVVSFMNIMSTINVQMNDLLKESIERSLESVEEVEIQRMREFERFGYVLEKYFLDLTYDSLSNGEKRVLTQGKFPIFIPIQLENENDFLSMVKTIPGIGTLRTFYVFFNFVLFIHQVKRLHDETFFGTDVFLDKFYYKFFEKSGKSFLYESEKERENVVNRRY